MTQEEKFLIDAGMVLLAYAYLADGYAAMAVFCALAAVYLAVQAHAPAVLLRQLPLCAGLAVLMLVCLSVCGWNWELLAGVELCNVFCAALWAADRRADLAGGFRLLSAFVLLALVLVLLVPQSALLFAGPDTLSRRLAGLQYVTFLAAPLYSAAGLQQIQPLHRARSMDKYQWMR